MLPEPYCQHCREFRQAVEKLTTIAAQLNSDKEALKAGIQELQKFFKQELTAPDGNGPALESVPQVRALWVEIDKQLRLLGMDLTFLKAARQSTTASQRQEQISDRLNLLLRYCDGLLGEEVKQ
ncbi:MAG: heterocyst frequency control protein PatD [Scytolyngbya sp. HA4215-MV1]|jgi:hypothetical protein|nr:heterocyst frequency control protein PatD [Scytolyngbya sp. HA4215-MV1]